MFHRGQRVNVQDLLFNPDRPRFVVATEAEVKEFYHRGSIAEPAILATDNIYHNHFLQRMTGEEVVKEFMKGFDSRFHVYYYHAFRVTPNDPCRNENAAIKLERIDE